jgi:alkanesulfonate monooxygenase SsuD/methylene tetrahydromethanopterin reductase-like flavin-dependent oxidoreductase (luciferase family)
MIGGAGERKTLRIVAQHADMWNVFGTPEVLVHKDEVLRAHCAEVGRDPASIERTVGCKITIRATEAEAERTRLSLLEHNRTPLERVAGDLTFWTGTPEQIAETMIGYRRIGFDTFIVELPAPYDDETIETLITQVKPMVEGAAVS